MKFNYFNTLFYIFTVLLFFESYPTDSLNQRFTDSKYKKMENELVFGCGVGFVSMTVIYASSLLYLQKTSSSSNELQKMQLLMTGMFCVPIVASGSGFFYGLAKKYQYF